MQDDLQRIRDMLKAISEIERLLGTRSLEQFAVDDKTFSPESSSILWCSAKLQQLFLVN